MELESRELVGEALLWGIDTHSRTARVGISLRPSFRGRGLGIDVLQALCEYGFAVRGLQRLRIETLTDNTPMIAAAARAGFTREGTLRRSAWVYGAYADEAVLTSSRMTGRPGHGQQEPGPQESRHEQDRASGRQVRRPYPFRTVRPSPAGPSPASALRRTTCSGSGLVRPGRTGLPVRPGRAAGGQTLRRYA
ncbi:GNAT family N-acetyltransferase [Streptomyces rhizosphaerihabitans]|uniref:GNAT family N-acetyltransferase n=1 Tax=Streptomyces rhizosphaerihabitans TaxID=1266770 RepID=UPI0028F741F9|nr:GNAT family protein [Streptomyces rhizosphaerihabitans]